jgi:HD-GYP domain-containing protein (c-di-GMP phosphodiesterase class II)
MVTGRAYRNAMSPEEAAEEIRRNAGTQFDPEIAKTFIEKVLKL